MTGAQSETRCTIAQDRLETHLADMQAKRVPMSRITFDPAQCGGRPCIRGMRIRVKDVLELLAAGSSETEILADFPYLEREDIRACLAFAAAEADHAVLPAAE
jgi:uncharacterized protein (DUF433 family)